MTVTDPARRDRLRELLDAVVDADNTDVGDMARSSFASEFHFSREVRRLTGESPAALRRRIMLERAAWRLRGGERVSATDIEFRLPAPNGLHFHPPQSLRLDSDGDTKEPDISQLMVAHDIADTAYLIGKAAELSKEQWLEEVSPGQVVLYWDGEEPSVGAVLGAVAWTKEVWLATIEGRDFPDREACRPESVTPDQLAIHHDDLGKRWSAMISGYTADGRLGDTIIALCEPPESFQLYGIVAHVLTYSAHRRQLARMMLACHGVQTRNGDPLDWMRGN